MGGSISGLGGDRGPQGLNKGGGELYPSRSWPQLRSSPKTREMKINSSDSRRKAAAPFKSKSLCSFLLSTEGFHHAAADPGDNEQKRPLNRRREMIV